MFQTRTGPMVSVYSPESIFSARRTIPVIAGACAATVCWASCETTSFDAGSLFETRVAGRELAMLSSPLLAALVGWSTAVNMSPTS